MRVTSGQPEQASCQAEQKTACWHFSRAERGAHALSAGTLTLIQHDLLIYFHSGNDVNGSILMPVCMEISENINAAGRRSCQGWRTLICIEWAHVHMCTGLLISLQFNVYLTGAKSNKLFNEIVIYLAIGA